MMRGVKYVLVLVAAMTAAIGHQQAAAQLLGGQATAAVEEVGAQIVGGHVGITGDFVSLIGQARYGVTSSFDLGAKAAFVDFEAPGVSSLALNADGRIQILDVFLQDPVDLAFGPEVTYFRAEGVSNWFFGGFAVVSKEFMLSNGKPLAPYCRLGVRMHRIEIDNNSSSEMDTGVSFGAKYGMSGYTSLWSEILIEDAGTGLYVGAQYQIR